MACRYCETIQGKKEAAKLHEDDTAVVCMAEQPATIGHVIIIPKQHSPIFEGLSETAVERLAITTNRTSISLFEAIKSDGTNIIINNGIAAGQEEPHVAVNIIARRDNDGLAFEWPPKEIGEEQMSTIELQLKQELEKQDMPVEQPEQKEEATETATKGEEKQEPDSLKDKEENYLIKQLRRMP